MTKFWVPGPLVEKSLNLKNWTTGVKRIFTSRTFWSPAPTPKPLDHQQTSMDAIIALMTTETLKGQMNHIETNSKYAEHI